MIAQCLISFGSNLGARDSLISRAARALSQSPLVHEFRTSRLFETPPIGGPEGQEPFLNAVAAFNTAASARQILDCLQELEADLGRNRRRRWDARSIDLDVVLHGELVGGGTGLIVPHPRYTARLFVLEPACDVAPSFRDPRFGWTIARLAEHLRQGVPSLALQGSDESTRRELCRRLQQEHGIATFDEAPKRESMEIVGHAPVTLPPSLASRGDHTSESSNALMEVEQVPSRWVSAFVPPLPSLDSPQTSSERIPRLIARIQNTTATTRWPAPHQMWPSGSKWPEYRLEIDDLDWAVSEIVSALDSMRCPAYPVTADGRWWA